MSKITDYSAFTSLASNDLLVGVDVSDTTMDATGTTKKLTLSQLGGAELYKFTSASSGSINNNVVIPSASYKIPANTLAVGSSFRLVFASDTHSAAVDLAVDTTQGTLGTSLTGGSTFAGGATTAIYADASFVCIAAGSSGVLLIGGAGLSSTSGNIQFTGSLTVNTTVDNWVELFNKHGSAATFTNYALIVTST